MTNIAKIEVLQVQHIENSIIVEVHVTIGSMECNRRYTLEKNATKAEIKKYINDKIIEEENRHVIGESFEVKLDG